MSDLVERQDYDSERLNFEVVPGEGYTLVFALSENAGGGSCARPVRGDALVVDFDQSFTAESGLDGQESEPGYEPVVRRLSLGDPSEGVSYAILWNPLNFEQARAAGASELWWKLYSGTDSFRTVEAGGRITLLDYGE